MKAVVVGGGIGGLCAAIGLRRAGIEVALFEQAAELKEVGAGLTLWPGAVRALEQLGVADRVREIGVLATGGRLLSAKGRVLYEGPFEWLGSEFLAVHRVDLQAVVLQALGTDAVRLGSRCTGFRQDEEGVTATFEGHPDEHGDILIGADGLHSGVRAQLFGRSRPRYAGYTAWRGVASLEHDRLPPPGSSAESWGRGVRFGLGNIGGGRIYWYGTNGVPEGEPESPGGRKREVLERFRGWDEPVEAVIEATEEAAILRNDIYDRDPLERWSEGRVTLLGDAAHPMTPDLGQGACQAIEDAAALVLSLQEASDDIVSALRLYETRRLPRANAVVRQSRRMGRFAQLENPLACRLRDLSVRATPERLRQRQIEWIVGGD